MSFLGNTPTTQSFTSLTERFNGNGSATTVTLSRAVYNASDIEVLVNNVQQDPYEAYTVNGTQTLTFTEAPSSGTGNIIVTYRSYIISKFIPGEGTVTAAAIADGSITGVKLASSTITGDKIGLTAITGNLIAATTITGDKIGLTAITSNLIASAAVTGDKIGLTAITGNLVAAASITGDKIGLTAITSNLIASGVTLTSPVIASANLTTALTLNGAAGTNGQVLTSAGSGLPSWTTISSSPTIVRSEITANTTLVTANASTFVDVTSGTITLAFTAAATLGSGWFCYIRNSGTGDTRLDPDASELIDGLTSYIMYPGEARLVQCTGTAFFSVVVSPFSATFTTTSTFIQPPGYKSIYCSAWGGGGGGGGGQGATSGTDTYGGGGGGGGARNFSTITAPAAGTSITATVGAGGTAGTGRTTLGGLAGGIGGTTSFGSYVFAYGGAGGAGGDGGTATAGGGGGAAGAGSTNTGGLPRAIVYFESTEKEFGTSNMSANFGFGGGAGYTGQSTNPRFWGCSEYGGSGGGSGGSNNQVAREAPRSLYGPTGGGGGGYISGADNVYGPSAGGGVGYQALGGGGAAGTSSLTVGTAGTAGTLLDSGSGAGGGGGGASGAGTGAVGGAGSVQGGGGGGGGPGRNTGGNGGAGGRGQINVLGIA